MMLSSIRTRLLATALIPVGMVVIVMVSIFGLSRLGDMNEAHQQRFKLLVSQVAQASEYGLFSGNLVNLQRVSEAALREPDVRAVTIFNAQGIALVRVGVSDFDTLAAVDNPQYVQQQRDRGVDVLSQPIQANAVELNDLFPMQQETPSPSTSVLGYVVVEVSRDRLRMREREIVYVSLLVGLVGVCIGGLLALRLSEAVMRPIARVSSRVQRIGQGDLSAESRPLDGDPLRDLQEGLDHMALRLAWGRDELEQRVAVVTNALRLKKDEAEAATLAKSRFLSAASHDLRQPTHALGLFIARLGQLPMGPEVRQLVDSLEASVQSMQDLLDGLLDLSRLESGAVSVHRRPVNVGALFDLLRSTLEPLAVAKGLRLRVRNSTHWGMTDGLLLHRMVMNLAHNAIRYTQTGTVLLACRPADDGQSVRIEVWDSGIGISQEHQSDIYKEFYQVGNSGRDRTHGLGLGLSIVERSARLLGHPLKLRSNLGCGTRFSISLPAAVVPVEAVFPLDAVADDLVGLTGVRVLVIEDDAAACDAIASLLVTWGCIVCAVRTAEEAYAALRLDAAPDVIVSDYRLGNGTHGLNAIATLRATAGYRIPACLMSGDTDGGLMQSARDANLTVLHKPVRPAKLRALLRRLVMAPPDGQGAREDMPT